MGPLAAYRAPDLVWPGRPFRPGVRGHLTFSPESMEAVYLERLLEFVERRLARWERDEAPKGLEPVGPAVWEYQPMPNLLRVSVTWAYVPTPYEVTGPPLVWEGDQA